MSIFEHLKPEEKREQFHRISVCPIQNFLLDLVREKTGAGPVGKMRENLARGDGTQQRGKHVKIWSSSFFSAVILLVKDGAY